MSMLSATVVITSKNRCEDLVNALDSVLKQSRQPQIIVVDDGSTDGTFDAISLKFPDVVLIRNESSIGCVASRNLAAGAATGDVIFSIDDDAQFTDPSTIEECLRYFDDARIGAVAIPFVNANTDPRIHQMAPTSQSVWITDRFIGTAHAVRRQIFLQLGGYRQALVHQGEEGDFCVRMLDAGYHVAVAHCGPIHHFESPRRDFVRMDYYGPRNALLFLYQNVPALYLPWRLATQLFLIVGWTLKPSRLVVRLRGASAAFASLSQFERRPVSHATYRRFRRLGRQKYTLIDPGAPVAPSNAKPL